MQPVADTLRKPNIRQWWDRVIGGLMLGAGALLARNGVGVTGQIGEPPAVARPGGFWGCII